MRIEYSPRASQDLESAIDNLLLVSEELAKRFADHHDATVERLSAFPRSGSPWRGGRYSVPVGAFGYRIVYELRDDVVRILRVENMRRARR